MIGCYKFRMVVQSLVSSLEKKVDEEGKKYEESNKLAMEAEIKIIKLKTDMQRLNYIYIFTTCHLSDN